MDFAKVAAVVLLMCSAVGISASADIVFEAHDYQNEELDVNFGISFSYSSIDSQHATIDIRLDNPEENRYFVSATGFAFNAPTADLQLADFSYTGSADSITGFESVLDPDGVKAGSYGRFDVGVSDDAIKKNINGGTPSCGILPGQSASFTLSLVGIGLDDLDAYDFLLLNSLGTSEQANQAFVVRWQSYTPPSSGTFSLFSADVKDDDSSGFALGNVSAQSDPPAVPAPGALLLCCIGIAFGGLRKLYRR